MPDRSPYVLGLDIGGANLKAADDRGRAHAEPFALWRHPEDLARRLRAIAERYEPIERYAVTMTGELADCFRDRAEGVRFIVDQCAEALGSDVRFYTVDGQLANVTEAKSQADDVASANWHALATFAAGWCGGEGLLIDIGSTTSDMIPVASGAVATPSRGDHDRLMRGELVYVGVGRTPVCALVDCLPYRGAFCPIMNEVFATTDDCALLTGLTAEDEVDRDTCDGRPRTIIAAANRIARMIGRDHRDVRTDEARSMADYVIGRVQAQLAVAAQVLSTPSATWILAGHGSILLDVAEDRRWLDLAAAMGKELSRVGPAYAVARIALRRDTGEDLVEAPE